MIFCHWWEELKWCQGVWAMFKRSWLFLFTTSPTFTWKVSLKTGSTVSIATCVLRTYSFKYTLETSTIISHCQFFLSNWPTFLLLAAMLMLFRLWGRTNTSEANYPRRKVCFQKNTHNYVDKKNRLRKFKRAAHCFIWKAANPNLIQSPNIKGLSFNVQCMAEMNSRSALLRKKKNLKKV